MIVGAVLFPGLVVVGVSVAIAGVIGLVTLLPRVRAWIDVQANGSSSAAAYD